MPLLRDESEFGSAAQAMVDRQLAARGIGDHRVLDAMRSVPRHAFVSPWIRKRAYDDAALPTLNDQTISQPYIVALMSELLGAGPGDRVLEVGTGSGYQTTILARLVGAEGAITTLERDSDLADQARRTLDEFGVTNVRVCVADGTLGYPPAAPYDRIIVTAGAPASPPPALLEQLIDGGRLVIPLGDADVQHLCVIDRDGDAFSQRESIACRFVPLVGEQGWSA